MAFTFHLTVLSIFYCNVSPNQTSISQIHTRTKKYQAITNCNCSFCYIGSVASLHCHGYNSLLVQRCLLCQERYSNWRTPFRNTQKIQKSIRLKRSATEPLLHLLTSTSFGSCWFVVASLLKLVKVHSQRFVFQWMPKSNPKTFFLSQHSSSYTMLKPAHVV